MTIMTSNMIVKGGGRHRFCRHSWPRCRQLRSQGARGGWVDKGSEGSEGSEGDKADKGAEVDEGVEGAGEISSDLYGT